MFIIYLFIYLFICLLIFLRKKKEKRKRKKMKKNEGIKGLKIIPLKINQNESKNIIIKARLIYPTIYVKTLIVKGVKST